MSSELQARETLAVVSWALMAAVIALVGGCGHSDELPQPGTYLLLPPEFDGEYGLGSRLDQQTSFIKAVQAQRRDDAAGVAKRAAECLWKLHVRACAWRINVDSDGHFHAYMGIAGKHASPRVPHAFGALEADGDRVVFQHNKDTSHPLARRILKEMRHEANKGWHIRRRYISPELRLVREADSPPSGYETVLELAEMDFRDDIEPKLVSISMERTRTILAAVERLVSHKEVSADTLRILRTPSYVLLSGPGKSDILSLWVEGLGVLWSGWSIESDGPQDPHALRRWIDAAGGYMGEPVSNICLHVAMFGLATDEWAWTMYQQNPSVSPHGYREWEALLESMDDAR